MDPLDRRDLVRRLQRNMEPKQKTGVNGSIEILSETDDDWNNNADDAKITSRLKGLSRVWHDFITEPKTEEDSDGEAFDMDEDPELTRKKRELREIREMIMRKKASLIAAVCKGATLKDRVKAILEQRHSVRSPSTVRCPVNRMNSSSSSNKESLQEEHPLKLRVKALMGQRCREACVSPAYREVPGVTLPLPRRSDPSPVREENSVNQGFQRFLDVLNKGVDMEFLDRIVNDDGEDLPLGEELSNIQPLATEKESGPFLRSESQGSNVGKSLLGCSRTNDGERKSNSPSQERSVDVLLPNESPSRLDLRVGSRSRSRSPSPVKKKKEGEEEKPKVSEQHAQLQNILNSLGLSLDEEEMTNLAKRTQERLYGTKDADVRADGRREQTSQPKGAHEPHRSASSSSTAASTSRSTGPSPSHPQRSQSGDSRRRRTSDRSDSASGTRDGRTSHEDSNEAAQQHRDRDEGGNEFEEISALQHLYPQHQTQPHAAELSAFPNHRLSQHSQCRDSRGSSSAATVSYWTYTPNGIPPSLNPRSRPSKRNRNRRLPASAVAPKMVKHCHTPVEDRLLLINPDLSACEGQSESVYGARWLSIMKQASTTRVNHRTRYRRRERRRTPKEREVATSTTTKHNAPAVVKGKAPHGYERDSSAKRPGGDRPLPTEKQIKENHSKRSGGDRPLPTEKQIKENHSKRSGGDKPLPTEKQIKENLSKRSGGDRPLPTEKQVKENHSKRSGGDRPLPTEKQIKENFSKRSGGDRPLPTEKQIKENHSKRSGGDKLLPTEQQIKENLSKRSGGDKPLPTEKQIKENFSKRSGGDKPLPTEQQLKENFSKRSGGDKPLPTEQQIKENLSKWSGGDKPRPTEQQIKEHLRIELKAFNQKMKRRKPTDAPDYWTSQYKPEDFHECLSINSDMLEDQSSALRVPELKAFKQKAKRRKPTHARDYWTSQYKPEDFHECHFDFNLQ